MTLTQLNAFVLVARLGSVTAAANALGVSEPAVSQALSALRAHLGDPLVSRGPSGMTLTAGGSRLLATASQIVVLGAEAHAAVRAAQGAPEQLRVVATSTVAEFVTTPLMEAFTKRFAGSVEVSSGVAISKEMPVLVANRLADLAIGPSVVADPALPVVSEPIFKYRLVVVAAGNSRPLGAPRQWRWLVDPSATDPGSDVGQVLAALRIPEDRIGVCSSQTAAWAAAADGGGVSLAVEHLVAQQLRRRELSLVDVPGAPVEGCWYVTMLERQQRSTVGSSLRRFLSTPEAMQLMRAPAAGVPPSRFRPPVYVTIWSLCHRRVRRKAAIPCAIGLPTQLLAMAADKPLAGPGGPDRRVAKALPGQRGRSFAQIRADRSGPRIAARRISRAWLSARSVTAPGPHEAS